MSSRLADPLYHRLRRTFPPGQPYTRADWEEETMPAVVRQFLEHRLRQHSRREVRQMRRARTDWVDYDHPEMEAAVRTFFDAVAAHTRVPADAWDDTLRHAVDYTTAYLVRPVPVLVEFVYGDQDDPLALDAIRERMQFFRPYPYLREAVRAYAEKREQDALSRGTFVSVLERVDEGIATDVDADRWLQLLGPLFEAGRHAFGQKRLPVPLLRTFFEEKGQDGIAGRLTEYGQEGTDEIAPEALARLIDGAQETTAEDPKQTPRPSAPNDSPFTDPPPESTPPADNAGEAVWGVSQSDGEAAAAESDPAPGNEEPLWKQFQQGKSGTSRAHTAERNGGRDTPRWAQFRQDRSTRADQIADTSENDAAEQASANRKKTDRTGASPKEGTDNASVRSSSDASFAPSSDSGSRPDRTRTESASASAGPGDLATLEREILGTENPSRRERYVEELFGGDPSAYRQVLRRLRTADTWSEASDIIASDIFRAHKVNIYSDAAVHFTNIVETRFKEREERP